MKNLRGWLRVSVLLAGVGVLCLVGGGRAADEKEVKANLIKAADALAKNDMAAAKAAVQELQKPTVEIDVIMDTLKLRAKGGLGVGPKKGTVKQDGIEAEIQALDKAAPTPKEAEAGAAALAQAGYVTAAVAQAVANKVPADKKKDAAKWKNFANDMEKASMAFVKAAESKDPKKIHAAAKELNNSCIKCHDMFR